MASLATVEDVPSSYLPSHKQAPDSMKAPPVESLVTGCKSMLTAGRTCCGCAGSMSVTPAP